MSGKKGKTVQIVVVNMFQQQEEECKEAFLDIMAKAMARKEKNIKVLPKGSTVID